LLGNRLYSLVRARAVLKGDPAGLFDCTSPDFTDTSLRWTIVQSEVVMSGARRRTYTEEFKTEAVRLQRESDKTIAAVAQELGIHADVLARWCREEHHAQARGTTRVALKVEADELVKLRREHGLLRKERDFLKSAAAYFARERK
jgi:transposase